MDRETTMHQCCLSKQPGDVVEFDVGVEVEEVVEVLGVEEEDELEAVDIDVIDDVEDEEEAKGRCQKKQRENVGILKKQRGGSSRIPLPFFTVFNMGDPPKKGPKMQNKP